jgi:molybdopterin/thiamine biosynthesis adenylyltransferase
MNDGQLLRYSRHILLDEIGITGQQRIVNAKVLIIGAGGLGSPAALYLASAGVGRITLADGDTVDLTNLQRQILHTQERVGQAKALSGQTALRGVNPEVHVQAIASHVAGEALAALVADADVVLDCCDNFATRHAVNRACVSHRTPLVSGAAIRFCRTSDRIRQPPRSYPLLQLPLSGRRGRRPDTLCLDGGVCTADWYHRCNAGGRSTEADHRRR